ncbi:MAG: WG repeat-containing protein [Candidatus Kapaibacterium sp.]
MKLKFTLLISIFALFIFDSFAQTPLVAYKQGQEWTFINSDGKQMFRAGGITDVGGYSEGLIGAQVILDRKLTWVYFDNTGKIKIRTNAEQGVPFNEGKAVIFNPVNPEEEMFEFGYVDSTGKVFKEIQYRDALSFSEGLAYVMKDGERGYIDQSGKIAIPLDENIVGYAFSEGLAAVSNDNYKVGFIDKEGNQIIDFILDIPSNFNNGLARVADTATGKIGFINKYGVVTIQKIYDEAYNMNEDRTMAGFYDDNYVMRWAMLDSKGLQITDFRFDHAKSFRNGAAVVMYDSRWGYIDSTGQFLFSKNFDYAESFGENGLAWVVDGEQVGFVDKSGTMVIPLPKADYYYDLRFNHELKTSTKVDDRNIPRD